MLIIERQRLEKILNSKGLNLSDLAKECGISRKSLYDMFEGDTIFTTPFKKVLSFLNIEFEEVTKNETSLSPILKEAPANIIKILLQLQTFAKEKNASLFLFGSRARGKKGIRADWDFAIYFMDKKRVKNFASFKEKLTDKAFPYSIDIVVLNDAPDWFIDSISNEAILIEGKTSMKEISIERSAA